MQSKHTTRLLARISAIVLALGVVWLWTFAKHNSYLPKSKVSRHVHAAMKLEVGQSKVQAVRAPAGVAVRIAPPNPRVLFTQVADPEVPSTEHPGKALALQNRPPPPQRA